MDKKYLFVVGTPRSGTTALGNVLAQHPQILMGIERYGHKIRRHNFGVTPELFEKERFLDIQPDDTFYSDFGFAKVAYENVEEKIETATYVGDKVPMLFQTADLLLEAFAGHDIKIVYIFRNIFDVAASYNARADKGTNWPATMRHEAAVRDWNQSFDSFFKAREKYPDLVFPVIYDRFVRSGNTYREILKFLDLEEPENAAQVIRGLTSRSEELEKGRSRSLDMSAVEFISQHGNFNAYQKICQIAKRDG